MVILCNGMPRSASTWSFNVVLGLLRRTDSKISIHAGYSEDPQDFVASAKDTHTHVVVKCHKVDGDAWRLIDDVETKVVYTYRDPADAVASLMQMFDTSVDRALDAIVSSFEMYRRHKASGTALIVDYTAIVASPQQQVRRIASYLQLAAGDRTIEAIAESSSFDRMRARSDALQAQDAARLDGPAYDPVTLLHPGHVRNGRIGDGKAFPTVKEYDRLRDALGRLLNGDSVADHPGEVNPR